MLRRHLLNLCSGLVLALGATALLTSPAHAVRREPPGCPMVELCHPTCLAGVSNCDAPTGCCYAALTCPWELFKCVLEGKVYNKCSAIEGPCA